MSSLSSWTTIDSDGNSDASGPTPTIIFPTPEHAHQRDLELGREIQSSNRNDNGEGGVCQRIKETIQDVWTFIIFEIHSDWPTGEGGVCQNIIVTIKYAGTIMIVVIVCAGAVVSTTFLAVLLGRILFFVLRILFTPFYWAIVLAWIVADVFEGLFTGSGAA
ncbi:hypothetical protein V8F20_011312 [Naviculisporaceae sp. PSN 640]